jgi:hypothetical protein
MLTMQGYHLTLHSNCSQSSKSRPRHSPAAHMTGSERSRRSVVCMIASAQVARCHVAPVDTLPAISRHTVSIRISRVMPNPYWTCIGPYACGCTGFSLPKPHSTILTPRFRYNSTPLSETTHHAYASAHHNCMTPQDALLRMRTTKPPGNAIV